MSALLSGESNVPVTRAVSLRERQGGLGYPTQTDLTVQMVHADGNREQYGTARAKSGRFPSAAGRSRHAGPRRIGLVSVSPSRELVVEHHIAQEAR